METSTNKIGTGVEKHATFGWIPVGLPGAQQAAVNTIYSQFSKTYTEVVGTLPGGLRNPYAGELHANLLTCMYNVIGQIVAPFGGNH